MQPCNPQVSLERQKRQLELRYQAETEKLRMAAEEDLVNRFRAAMPRAPAPAPARPTPREEATTGGSSSSVTAQEPFAGP